MNITQTIHVNDFMFCSNVFADTFVLSAPFDMLVSLNIVTEDCCVPFVFYFTKMMFSFLKRERESLFWTLSMLHAPEIERASPTPTTDTGRRASCIRAWSLFLGLES